MITLKLAVLALAVDPAAAGIKVTARSLSEEQKEREDPSCRRRGRSFGGVDYYGSTKEELYKRAGELDVRGRSKMTKEQLAEAIARKQR